MPEGWAQTLDLFLGELADAVILPADEDSLRLAALSRRRRCRRRARPLDCRAHPAYSPPTIQPFSPLSARHYSSRPSCQRPCRRPSWSRAPPTPSAWLAGTQEPHSSPARDSGPRRGSCTSSAMALSPDSSHPKKRSRSSSSAFRRSPPTSRQRPRSSNGSPTRRAAGGSRIVPLEASQAETRQQIAVFDARLEDLVMQSQSPESRARDSRHRSRRDPA